MAESYGITETNLTADNLFAGNHPPVEIPVTIKSGSGSLLRGALLGRRTSDGKYAPIDPGTAYAAEDIGDGNGTTKTFTPTLAHPGIKPGSPDFKIYAVVVGDTTETFSDNGDGTLTSDGGGSGTIDYASGAVSVTFNTAPKNGVNIYSDYVGALDKVTAEAIGTGTAGGQKEWSGYLASTKVVPKSIYFYTNDTTPLTARDNGNGEIVGDATGSINYETGEYDIIFETAPADGKTIKADYCTYDGTETARAVLARAIDATSADGKVVAYVHGEFNRAGVVWPTGTSETQKDEIARDCTERGIYIKARIV